MKRILLALALILAVQVADAQATADAARKSIDKATEATLNPKKSVRSLHGLHSVRHIGVHTISLQLRL